MAPREGIEPAPQNLFLTVHSIHWYMARVEGVEPPCVQLLFQVLRRHRRYTRMTINCTECQKEFNKSPSQMIRSTNHFCSRSCSVSFANKNHPKREGQGNCKTCDTRIRNKLIYCSTCTPKVDWSDRTLEGEWAKREYQKNSRIRTLARSIYAKSTKPKQCLKCGYANHFEVCHIQGISSFPPSAKISEVNSINNLIALCPNHHWELDHGKLSIADLIT